MFIMKVTLGKLIFCFKRLTCVYLLNYLLCGHVARGGWVSSPAQSSNNNVSLQSKIRWASVAKLLSAAASHLDKTDIYFNVKTADDSDEDVIFRRLQLHLLMLRSGILLHKSLSDADLASLSSRKYVKKRSASTNAKTEFFRNNSTTSLSTKRIIKHITKDDVQRFHEDDTNGEFELDSSFETDKTGGKVYSQHSSKEPHEREITLNKPEYHLLASTTTNREPEGIPFKTSSRTWSAEFVRYRNWRWRHSRHRCHHSAPNTPAKRAPECVSHRWPMTVHFTDSASLVPSLAAAEALYQLDWGAVAQMVIVVDTEAWPSALPQAFSVRGSPSKMLVASYNTATDEAELWTVYKFRDSGYVVQKLGEWTWGSGLKIAASYHDGLTDFQGGTLYLGEIMLNSGSANGAGFENCAPEYRHQKNASRFPCSFELDIIEQAARNLNFTYEVHVLEEVAFGGGYTDNCYGLVGKLCKREIDAAVTALVLSASYRIDVADATFPLEVQRRTLLYSKARETTTYRWTTFIEGLDWSVWAVVVALTVLSTLIGVCVRRATDSGDPQYKYVVEAAFLHASTLFQQGWPGTPKSAILRLVFLNYSVMSLAVFVFYTGRLTSFLSATRYVRPFTSLREAVADDWNVVTFKGSILHTALLSLDEQWAARFNEKIARDPSSIVISSRPEGMQRAETSKTAFLEFSMNLMLSAQEKGICKYDFVPIGGVKTDLYFTIEKNLPFKRALTNTLFKLRSTGIMKRIINKRRFIKPVDCNTNVFLSFGFLNTVSAFVMLAAGCGVAWVVLVVELLFSPARWGSAA